jgi:hypothetical protein
LCYGVFIPTKPISLYCYVTANGTVKPRNIDVGSSVS